MMTVMADLVVLPMAHGLPESVFLAIPMVFAFEFVPKTFYHDEVVFVSAEVVILTIKFIAGTPKRKFLRTRHTHFC